MSYKPRLNFRLKDIFLDKATLTELNSLANDLGMRNTDLLRHLVKMKLNEIAFEGKGGCQLAIVTPKEVK